MHYNQLGTTDMKVSHIGLGGAAFGNLYEKAKERDHVEVIRECLRSKINYMETGYWYGQGASEKAFAKALKGVPRESYYIASKVGRYSKEVSTMFDFSAERTTFEVEQTLARLQLTYVDLIQVHDITFAPSLEVIRKETLPALLKAVNSGQARYIGICDYDIGLVKELVEDSEIEVSTVLTYAKSCLIDNRLHKYTKYFKDRGIGVINASPTGMGILTNNGPQAWHPASDLVKQTCRRAAEYCSSQNVELGRLAMWFAVSQPNIDTNVCGFTNVHQLRDTLAVMKYGLTPNEQKVLAHVQRYFFNKGPMHWDDVERQKYAAEMATYST